MIGFVSLDLQPRENHVTCGVVINRPKPAGQTVETDQPADTDFGMVGAEKIINASKRELVDGIDSRAFNELVFLHTLRPREQGDAVLEDGGTFEQVGIERVAGLFHLAPPRRRRAPQVVIAEWLRVNRRHREAIFVALGFELLGGLKMPPRYL